MGCGAVVNIESQLKLRGSWREEVLHLSTVLLILDHAFLKLRSNSPSEVLVVVSEH